MAMPSMLSPACGGGSSSASATTRSAPSCRCCCSGSSASNQASCSRCASAVRATSVAFDDGALDAAIVLGHDAGRRDGEVLLTEAFGWMAAREFAHRADDQLPLAEPAESCNMRSMGVAALDAAGIPWTEVFVGGGVGTVDRKSTRLNSSH